MARISGVNIPTGKRVHIALTYIYGIGPKIALDICKEAAIDKSSRVNQLDDDKVNKSRNWIMINNKYGEKFKIEGPATIRVFSRYMIDNNTDENINSYVLKFYEDEKWVSEFDVNIVKSVKNARIVNKGFGGYDLSKFKSFYYNVPLGTHYYTVKIPVASEDNKFIFKVEEYEIK